MIPGVVHPKTIKDDSLTLYLYAVPFMVLGSGTIVKMRTHSVVVAMSEATDIAGILRAVLRSNTNDSQRYAGVILSYRGVKPSGVVVSYCTHIALVDASGNKVVKQHLGNIVKMSKVSNKNLSYTINVSRDVDFKTTKEADFVICPKTGETLAGLAKDILSVCMLLSTKQESFKRMVGLLGMQPEQSTILTTVKHQDVNMRSIGVKALKTGVKYTFNLWGENY